MSEQSVIELKLNIPIDSLHIISWALSEEYVTLLQRSSDYRPYFAWSRLDVEKSKEMIDDLLDKIEQRKEDVGAYKPLKECERGQ